MIEAVIRIDKAAGPTSHDVVRDLRRAIGMRRVGHAGTLDPFATGLLVCCVGGATRIAAYLADGAKEYSGRIQLGIATDSLDPTGDIVERRPVPAGWEERLAAVAAELSGTRDQVPPMTSARRVGGRRLYELARAGVEIEREARPVEIHQLTLAPRGAAEVELQVRCSKGTYVRVLAAEVGAALGTCAHLRTLRRLRSGVLEVAGALPSTELATIDRRRLLASPAALSAAAALEEWPAVIVDAMAARAVGHGRPPAVAAIVAIEGSIDAGDRVRLLGPGRELLALAESQCRFDADHGARQAAGEPAAAAFRFLRVLCAATDERGEA